MNWKDWLSSPQCHPVLERAACIVLNQVRRKAIPHSLLPDSNGIPHQDYPQRGTSSIQAMVNTLWLYANQQADAWEERYAFASLYDQGAHRLAAFVAHRYTRHLLDLSRTQQISPGKALYRRLRQCLHNHDKVQYDIKGGHASYACSQEPLKEALQDDPAVLHSENYHLWPPPEASLRLNPEGLTKEKVVHVACSFWHEAVRRLGKPCWVPVRELTRYLMAHLPMPPSEREVLFSDLSSENENDSSPLDFEVSVEGSQEKELLRQDLPRLAQKLIADWDDRERFVFYAYYAMRWTLADIARETGYRGAAGARYLLTQLILRIKDFCLLWSGLSSWDEDHDLAAEFLEEILKACKSAWQCRSSWMKGSTDSDASL
ncbi:MAG: hypothetical protein WHS46_02805 [Desulfosoma sp.]